MLIAAVHSHKFVVARLLSAGADPEIKDAWGRTAADLAPTQVKLAYRRTLLDDVDMIPAVLLDIVFDFLIDAKADEESLNKQLNAQILRGPNSCGFS